MSDNAAGVIVLAIVWLPICAIVGAICWGIIREGKP